MPPAGTAVYTFDGVAFYRIVSGEYPPWFATKAEYTQDLVLGSDQDYLDIGATSYDTLQIRAAVLEVGDREALIGKIGTTAVLSNSKTRSQDATLVAANPVDLGTSAYHAVDLTFVRRPTGSG